MTTLTAMESEILLLAMLPEEDRVLVVQTPRLRTIADLEDLIVDEYSRVFPLVPALSRDLRIQKCVSPELVVDHRSHATVLQQDPHRFLDLSKNVQVGNVFQNMEQIYVLLNKQSEKAMIEAAPKKKVSQKLSCVASNVPSKRGADGKQEQLASKKITVEASQKQQALKKVTAVATNVQGKSGVERNKKAEKEVQNGKKKQEQQVLNMPFVEGKPLDTKQKASSNVTKTATEEIRDSNDTKKVTVVKAREKKADVKEKSKETAKREKSDAKKTAKNENKSDSMKSVKVLKKIAPKRSENALLKKMLAAKHSASQSGAALVVDSFQIAGAPQAPLKSERKRKAIEEDVLQTDENSASGASEPVTKRKKTVKKSADEVSEPIEDEACLAMVEKLVKKTAAQDKIKKTVKKKAAATTNSIPMTDGNSSTASESAPGNHKLKKKNDSKSDNVEEPVVKRAKTEVLPDAVSIVKKAPNNVKRAAKPATPKSDTSASPSSQSSSSSAIQEDELAFGEETEAVETPAAEEGTTVKSNEKPKDASKQIADFQKVMADTTQRIADEKKAKDAKVITTVTPEKRSTQPESTASESSSDSDQPPVVVKVVKHSRKNATPEEGSSSSSSEEEELDYSQSLLAEFTKNDADEEEVVPVVLKKGKKSKQVDWRDDSTVHTSQNIEQSSSKLAQKSQESNSVLLPPLSRNRFSLGSMPVAKLKKSSKNPFSSPKKVKAKAKTSNGTDRPRGRPRKKQE